MQLSIFQYDPSLYLSYLVEAFGGTTVLGTGGGGGSIASFGFGVPSTWSGTVLPGDASG